MIGFESPLIVEVLTANACGRCAAVKRLVREVLSEFPEERFKYTEIDVVEDIDYAVSIGVERTPAIAVAGTLLFNGPPSRNDLRQALNERIEGAGRTRDQLDQRRQQPTHLT